MTDQIKAELQNICAQVLFDEPMAKHTSFKIGGPADVWINAHSSQEVVDVLRWGRENGIPVTVMGNGSNMLVGDGGIRGIVLTVGAAMTGIEVRGNCLYAQAGALLSSVSKAAAEHSLGGLEFAGGIPGTVGGGIFMNAGAYGGELKDVLKEVTFLTPEREQKTLPASELDLSYRHSMFSAGGYIILDCVMELVPADQDEILKRMADFRQRRAEKQPLNLPSAGSTFKRPEGYFAGKLIQDAGLQGFRVGGAQVSEKHAGFVVNTGGATAQDVMALIEHVQRTVLEKFGVMLEPEVRMIGER